MAVDKKSFVLYTDFKSTFEELSDLEAGRLIKHIFKYVTDEDPEMKDRLLRVAFEPIKQQLKRDLRKYEAIKVQRSIAGKKGGEKSGEVRKSEKVDEIITISESTTHEANEANGSFGSQNEANEAVNDNVNVNVTVIKRPNGLVLAADKPDLRKCYQELIDGLVESDVKTVWIGLKNFISQKSPPFIEPYQDAWNLFANNFGLAKVEVINDTRKKKLKTRLGEPEFDFIKVLEKIKGSRRLKGIDTGNDWKVTFDWIFENQSNYVKILEGNYDGS
jgi:hypothetical protein